MGRPKGSKNKPKLSVNKTLMELAQDLVTYCTLNGSESRVNLDLFLPKSVVERASLLASVTDGKVTGVSDNNVKNFTVNVNGGTVNFKSAEATVGT